MNLEQFTDEELEEMGYFCKCSLPHSQCVCNMTEEDWEAWSKQLKELDE